LASKLLYASAFSAHCYRVKTGLAARRVLYKRQAISILFEKLRSGFAFCKLINNFYRWKTAAYALFYV